MKHTLKQILIPALLLTFVTACEKSELTKYDQSDMVYIYKDYFSATKDSVTYSFAIKPTSLSIDTVKVPLRIMGVAKTTDRTVTVRAVPDSSTAVAGQHYDFLPVLIKAGEYAGNIPVLVKKTGDLKTGEKRLLVEVMESSDFKPGIPNTVPLNPRAGGSLRFLIKINDALTKPANWDTQLASYFGTYSQAKYKFVIEVTGRTEFIFGSGADNISTSQILFYKTSCKNALLAYEAANGPMLDENGIRITFPN